MGRHRGTVGAGRQRRSGRRKSRAWSLVGPGMGTKTVGGVGEDRKVGVGTVKKPKLQSHGLEQKLMR